MKWLGLVSLLASAYVVAWTVGRFSERVTAGHFSTARWILVGTSAIFACALIASVLWSKSYWGYYFNRPPAQESIPPLRRITAVAPIQCTKTARGYVCSTSTEHTIDEYRDNCAKDAYYCLGGRVAFAASHARVPLPKVPSLPSGVLQRIAILLASTVVPVEPGYSGNDELNGMALVSEASGGESILVFGLAGGQIANDHFPYYEIAAPLRGSLDTPRRTIFYWDFAGIEGLEWVGASMLLAFLGINVWLPVAIGVTMLIGRRRNLSARRAYVES